MTHNNKGGGGEGRKKLRITAMLDSMKEFSNGCFFTRIHVPFLELKRRGHETSYTSMRGYHFDEVVESSDIIFFMRVYNNDPFRHIWRLKAAGKKIVYEIDDDVWNIPKTNPAHNTFEIKQKDVEGGGKESDAVTVSTEPLAELMKPFNSNIFVCPNAIDRTMFKPRPNKGDRITIGWSGGANHYEDLEMVLPAIIKLSKKYDFDFIIQGLTSSPLEAEMYGKHMAKHKGALNDDSVDYVNSSLKVYDYLQQIPNFKHVPFYPPELYTDILSKLDYDIGITPVLDNEFNKSKSCIKFYEYASVGTVTLSSDVEPYKSEVNYRAKNTEKDWYNKLEALINDEELRKEILKEQQEYVFSNRDIKVVGDIWEDALYKIDSQN